MRMIYKEYDEFDLLVMVKGKIHSRKNNQKAIKENGLFNTAAMTEETIKICKELGVKPSQVVTTFIPSCAEIIENGTREYRIRLPK